MKSKALQLLFGLAAVSLLAFGGCTKDDEGDKKVPVTSVTITEGSTLGVVVGETRTLHATVQPDNASEKTVTWSSSAPTVISVNSSTGAIEALAVGNATVTASAGGKSAAIQLTVAPAPVPLTGLTIDPAGPLTLHIGDEQTLRAVLTPEDATDVTVVWSSANANVVSVDAATGELKALAIGGPVTITATAGTITATCQVTVQALKYAITLDNDGRGTGTFTVNGAGAEEAEEGATIALTATPAAGYIFKGWTVVEGGITLTPGTATGTATFTMPAVPVSLRAEFTIETVKIPAGTFMMGSPPSEYQRMGQVGGDDYELQHSVTLTKDFYMGKYEVTNAQYVAFLNAKGVEYSSSLPTISLIKQGAMCTWGENSGKAMVLVHDWGVRHDGERWVPQSGYENHPVNCVTWWGALEYARWLGGTLPTEAQWEYACRGDYPNKATETNTLPFGVGTGRKLTAGMANFKATEPYDLDRHGKYKDDTQTASTGTTAVGSYPANNYGLHDMHGNVSERCLDWYTELYYKDSPAVDPTGPATGTSYVMRGAFFLNAAEWCRTASRNSCPPDWADRGNGFRVVLPE